MDTETMTKDQHNMNDRTLQYHTHSNEGRIWSQVGTPQDVQHNLFIRSSIETLLY